MSLRNESSERDAFELRPPEELSIEQVSVHNRLGTVTVLGHDRDVITVKAIKTAGEKDALERLVVSMVPDAKGVVHVTTSLGLSNESKPILAGSVAVDLTVYVPRDAMVSARTWMGDVKVRGVENGASAHANRGDIDVSEVSGRVETESVRGDHDLQGIVGAVRSRGIEGDMTLNKIRGDTLFVRVHKGNISGQELKIRELIIRNTAGRIELSDIWQAGGRYKVSTIDGDIVWRSTGRKSRVRVRGKIEKRNLPKNIVSKLEGQVTVFEIGGGKGEAVIELASINGSVTVAKF